MGQKFTDAFKEDIKHEFGDRLVDMIVKSGYPLKKTGPNTYKGCCPFHSEKTGSFVVTNGNAGWHYYCLAGETEVITWDGVKRIREISGTVQRILNGRGEWVNAPIKSFGVQKLYRIELSRSGVRKEIFATGNHRWFTRNLRRECSTLELRPGFSLKSAMPPLVQVEPQEQGICHGITFGDGTRVNTYKCHMHLHGEKAYLAHHFSAYKVTPEREKYATYVSGLPHTFKALPDINSAPDYLLGFIAGYVAADGHVAEDGSVMLYSKHRENLEFVRLACLRLGIATYGVIEHMRKGYLEEPGPIYQVNFAANALPLNCILKPSAAERYRMASKKHARMRWNVQSISETDRVEEVYCAVVDGTHDFTLADNILTGNCHGACKVFGDAYHWLQNKGHMEFVEAVEYLAGQVGKTLPGVSPEQAKVDEYHSRLCDIVNRTSIWLQQRLYLPAADPVRAYLTERGIDEQDIRNFMIGYAPTFIPNPRRGDDRQWQDFIADLMVQFRFTRKELIDSGVFSEERRRAGQPNRQEDGMIRPFFSNRLMFTICDYRGRPVGFSGRTMIDGETPKYINTSNETPIFHKGSLVYNAHRARQQASRTNQDVLVVEGYTDVIEAEKKGFGPVVSCMGTAVTVNQLDTIFRVRGPGDANVPVFCFDGDAAGRSAALAVSRLLLPVIRPGRYARIATLFDAHDPASLLRMPTGKASLQGAIDDAIPAPLMLFEEEIRNHQPLATPESKAAFVAQRTPFRAVPEIPGCLSESTLLAALLNHPSLFHEYAEDLTRNGFTKLEEHKRLIVARMGYAEDDFDARRIAAELSQDPEIAEAVFPPMLEDSAPFVAAEASPEDVRIGITGILRHMQTQSIRDQVARLMPTLDGSPSDQEKLRQVAALLASLGGDMS